MISTARFRNIVDIRMAHLWTPKNETNFSLAAITSPPDAGSFEGRKEENCMELQGVHLLEILKTDS